MKTIMALALLVAIIAEFYLHFSMYKLSERVDNFEEWVVFLLQKRNDGTTQVVRCREGIKIADRLDRKTENSSEKPNNCEPQIVDWGKRKPCTLELFDDDGNYIEPKDEP